MERRITNKELEELMAYEDKCAREDRRDARKALLAIKEASAFGYLTDCAEIRIAFPDTKEQNKRFVKAWEKRVKEYLAKLPKDEE